jgi:Uma2 family endonuclease
MTVLPPSRWVTATDFAGERAFEYQHYLLDGKVFEDITGSTHEAVKSRWAEALIILLDTGGIRGRVFVETAYELNRYTVLIPDLSVQLPERPIGPGFFQDSPEVVIEILSPANSRYELDRKARAYWAHGGGAVWVLDSETHTIFEVTSTGEWITRDSIEIAGHKVEAVAWPEAHE